MPSRKRKFSHPQFKMTSNHNQQLIKSIWKNIITQQMIRDGSLHTISPNRLIQMQTIEPNTIPNWNKGLAWHKNNLLDSAHMFHYEKNNKNNPLLLMHQNVFNRLHPWAKNVTPRRIPSLHTNATPQKSIKESLFTMPIELGYTYDVRSTRNGGWFHGRPPSSRLNPNNRKAIIFTS